MARKFDWYVFHIPGTFWEKKGERFRTWFCTYDLKPGPQEIAKSLIMLDDNVPVKILGKDRADVMLNHLRSTEGFRPEYVEVTRE